MPERLDSRLLRHDEALFFARELEHVKVKVYEKVYPELKAQQLIPISTEAGPGAEVITYRTFDMVGMAKIIANYSDDLPRVDVKGEEYTSKVKSMGASYGYSIQEIRSAQMANRPLEQRKANAVRKAFDQGVNQIAWFGDAAFGIKGFLRNPNITSSLVATGAGGKTTWADKTADEILDDMNGLCNGITDLTNGVEHPDTLVLPVAQYALIHTRPRSSTSDTTIAEFFLKNHPSVKKLEQAVEMKGITPAIVGGGDSADIMLAYQQDADVLTLEIPQMFEQFPAQERNLEFVIPCHQRIGGVIIYKPLAVAIGEGI